ncbi:HesA/MoeB/ThiF family protein [Pseudoalteromonas byunsanensis]|uniref:Molybdopterin-synthase adenylyltransferase MoeB n=1 Tax=Pseudoalteromonas byunsanensis TaxID=327939 RepID=A0A1S1NC40_9GAMM|nr:HesA/MoeB/ThiF family protein [Pseudoalteromonas byunsanensis]OHU96281.1 molybdopterin-synthase adenylyltransferase MoeB [Pseudoalteromonas byunsanensis]
MTLSDKERLRYSRHLLLKEVGEQGQLKLKNAHVAVIGCGGLGSPALFYLAASGVGNLTFIDDDQVELSNLQRQILYKVNHIGQAKSKAASKVLASLNNDILLNPVCAKVAANNIGTLLASSDVVLDCSDNFETRYLLNRYCLKNKKVLISGAAIATSGQVMCFDFRDNGPCYSCIFPSSDKGDSTNCDNFGVLSPLLGMIGTQQALLAVNTVLGHHQGSYFYSFDALTFVLRSFVPVKDVSCSDCSQS